MIEHFYQNIDGWFNYDYVYKNIVEQLEDGGVVVEIGSFKGKSTAFMAVEIANSGKKIQFDCIDPMQLLGHYAESAKQNPKEWEGYSVDEFHKRLEPVKDFYNLRQLTSNDAVELYEDNSIDFLLIDGDHSYAAVKQDVINWIPKMRAGGLIVGDDAYVPEITQAAREGAAHHNLESRTNGLHFFIEIPE